MKILVIEDVNFIDYPTGGIMAFYRSMLPAFGEELVLAGTTTEEDDTPVGVWTHKEIYGIVYDYFSIGKEKRRTSKPLMPRRITTYMFFKKHIREVLEYKNFDLIFTQSPEALFAMPITALKKTCFLSAGLTNPLSISRYPWARLLANIYNYFLVSRLKNVEYMLAAADYNARVDFSNRSKGVIKAQDIIQFPTRYDDAFYKVIDKKYCREMLEISSQTTLFVTVGRLNWFKGWKLMIDSFAIVLRTNGNAILIFVGDGEEFDRISDYIKDSGLIGKVILVGKKSPSQLALYLNAADEFIMGSYTEGWSTTLVEACACGVPCVITSFSSAKEMVKNGKNGYVVGNRNEDDFAQCMLDALSLDRNSVVDFDSHYENLSISNLKNDFYQAIGKTNC